MTWTSARDCRSILIPFLAEQPGRVFTAAELAAELATELEGSGLQLTRRPDRMVFDAMRKAERSGWVVRVGRGRYRFGTVPPTTLRRIRRWRDALDAGLDGYQRAAYSNWRPVSGFVPPRR